MANEYSRRWFSAFMDTVPAAWTEAEVEGVCRRLPQREFRRVLDVCCGPARHAALLADRGYEVIGVDRDEAAIVRAREAAPTGEFVVLDQRSLSRLHGLFDAALLLWQSFGYFDSETNDHVLTDLAGLLRSGGRLLLDLYHPGWVQMNQGRQTRTRSADCEAITNTVIDGRLTSTIEYVGGGSEVMNFELFEPAALLKRAEPLGFEFLEACCWWDETRPRSFRQRAALTTALIAGRYPRARTCAHRTTPAARVNAARSRRSALLSFPGCAGAVAVTDST